MKLHLTPVGNAAAPQSPRRFDFFTSSVIGGSAPSGAPWGSAVCSRPVLAVDREGVGARAVRSFRV